MADVVYGVPTWILGVLIVGLSAGVSALALVVVHRRISNEVRRTQNDIAGYISNIAAFVYAVLLAFLAVAVWQNYQSVQSIVQLEANAASDVYRQADGYPPALRQRVRDGIREYVDRVIADEWPRLSTGGESLVVVRGLHAVHGEMLRFQPADARERIVQDQQLLAMKSLLDQRRNRIYASGSGLHPVVWAVIVIGSVLIIAFCLFMGTANVRAHLAMTALLGASIGLVIFLIVALDRPFRGSVGIAPGPFVHIRGHMLPGPP
jgi:hypothetical protein